MSILHMDINTSDALGNLNMDFNTEDIWGTMNMDSNTEHLNQETFGHIEQTHYYRPFKPGVCIQVAKQSSKKNDYGIRDMKP